jgi:hypothetical protein
VREQKYYHWRMRGSDGSHGWREREQEHQQPCTSTLGAGSYELPSKVLERRLEPRLLQRWMYCITSTRRKWFGLKERAIASDMACGDMAIHSVQWSRATNCDRPWENQASLMSSTLEKHRALALFIPSTIA